MGSEPLRFTDNEDLLSAVDEALKKMGPLPHQRPGHKPTPTDETLEDLKKAAELRAAGWSLAEIARAFQMKPGMLSKQWSVYRDLAEEEYQRALAEQPKTEVTIEAPVPCSKQPGPRRATRKKIRRAAVAIAMGMERQEIGESLRVHPDRIREWDPPTGGRRKAVRAVAERRTLKPSFAALAGVPTATGPRPRGPLQKGTSPWPRSRRKPTRSPSPKAPRSSQRAVSGLPGSNLVAR